MKKYTVSQLLSLLGMPVLTAVLGLILLVNPDSAVSLVGKLLGWVCVIGALAFAFGGSGRRNVVGGIVLGALGVWMLCNPLFLAKILSRVLGVFLLLRGIQDGRLHWQGKLVLTPGLILAAAAALIGFVLVLMPLSTSRVFFRIIGIILICVGAAEGIDRLRGRKLLDGGEDPNIIDVEKL